MLSPSVSVNGYTLLVKKAQSGTTSHMTSAKATDIVFTPDPRLVAARGRQCVCGGD
jgi:hypothetical protein